ncbi:hypothetical protein N9Y63_08475, partial [Akkermansiaceae bacterium]|nr:hypothetical protein [Akkermansiaceae bacterium]
ATLILDDGSGPEIRYNAGIRVRGAGSRNHDPVPMRVTLPRDNEWNNMTTMNLNTKFTYLQFLGMKLFEASGMQAPDTFRAQVRINGENIARDDAFDYGSIVHVQPLSGEFLKEKFEPDDGGNIYKKVRPDRDPQFCPCLLLKDWSISSSELPCPSAAKTTGAISMKCFASSTTRLKMTISLSNSRPQLTLING